MEQAGYDVKRKSGPDRASTSYFNRLRPDGGPLQELLEAVSAERGANAMLALKSCVMNLRLPDFLDWQVRQAVAGSH